MKPQLRSRILAVALLLAALLAGWALAVAPLLAMIAEGEQELADAEERLFRLKRIAAARRALEAEANLLRQDAASGRLALGGANAQLAAAEMQDRVKRLVESNGAVLKSTQVLAGREEKGFRRVALRVTIEGDTDAAQKIFHALETVPPLLFLDNVEIRSRGVQTASAGRRSIAELIIAYDLYGFQRLGKP
jgi:general secretion pathway protein M